MGGVRDGVSTKSCINITQSFDKCLNPLYLKITVVDVEDVALKETGMGVSTEWSFRVCTQ